MRTIEMEVALMQHFNIRKNVIVPNVSWGIDGHGRSLHEVDLLVLTPTGYATEIEIKITKSDLLKDVKKRHGHDHPLIKRVFFAVPEKLKEVALKVIDPRFGLLVVYKLPYRYTATEIRPAKQLYRNKWSDKQRQKLLHLGCMRILGLKQKLI